MKTSASITIPPIAERLELKEFEPLVFTPVMSVDYSSLLRNKYVEASSNLLFSMNGTANGDTGIVAIKVLTDNISLQFNGVLDAEDLPTDSGNMIRMQYININGNLYWNCLNFLP